MAKRQSFVNSSPLALFTLSAMPAEPSKPRLKRRSSRRDSDEYRFDGSHARELEQKRSRGEISCAECRRLKIKCDKKIPCQSCQRRGCGTLCPNGSLSTGQGTRFVLAATEHLHHQISRLSSRIRQLEDALETLQAQYSSEPHPLLHEDLMEMDEEGYSPMVDVEGTVGHVPDVIDTLGTLSISDNGISRFFGPTGGSESLLSSRQNAPCNSDSTKSTPSPDSPVMQNRSASANSTSSGTGADDLRYFSQFFPFTPVGRTSDVQTLVESHLPPLDRAQELGMIYLAQASWIFQSITRPQLMDDMLPAIYRRQVLTHDRSSDHFDSSNGSSYTGPHDLALVFIVFAVAALVQKEPSDVLGEHFYQIAKVAMTLQPVLEKPSIVTIQVLHLMSVYNAMSGNDLKSETSMEVTWSLVTMAAHLSQTIGLHRDSARWGLSPKMVQRRRLIFWDLFVADAWQSLSIGRPPSFSLAYIDCAFPQPEERSGEKESFAFQFRIWQFRFASECVADVAARTLTAEAPSYATIMELDKKVREFPLPGGSLSLPNDFSTSFQKCVLEHIRESILLYIHRSFFAQAIIDQPTNPLKSPYASSFLAAYRASSTILKSVKQHFDVWPNSSSRFWVMWTLAFSAAVVFGTVVTRGPRSPLAQSAMSELEQACILFSKSSVYSIRASKALAVLTRLREKAQSALASVQKERAGTGTGNKEGHLWNIKQEDPEDELSIFAGHTRFVSRNTTSQSYDKDQAIYGPPSVQPVKAAPPSSPRNDAEPTPQLPVPPPAASGSSLGNSWGVIPPPKQEPTNTRCAGDFMSMSSVDNVQYPYVPSERTHEIEASPSSSSSPSYRWSNQPSYSQQDLPSPISQPGTNRHLHSSAGSGGLSGYDTRPHIQYPSQPQRPLMSAPSPSRQQYARYLQHPQQYHHQTHYGTTLPFQPPMQGAGGALADLGLTSRDSSLDARWTSFMEDSGLLDSFEAQ